ncbi:MAG: HD domain-containing protein [Thermoanaerobacteraceae bacterium]|nr:HD domain-containing protein [Thermoanaerobacteraceae bacterium]
MNREQFRSLCAWFNNYVQSFGGTDAETRRAFRLKEEHTARVRVNIVRIGRSLDLGAGKLLLAEAVALLHDAGRFRQFAVYRTFSDRRSENHALLGLRELERAGVLSALPEEEQAVILKAIECHNLRDLPADLPERHLLFARLIRDADKLDILGLFAGECSRRDREPDRLVVAALPDTPGYSPGLVENLLRGKTCSYADAKNFNDRKLLHLSWIYDVNFPWTLAEIVRNGYIETIIEALPATREIQAVREHLLAYAARRQEPGAGIP